MLNDGPNIAPTEDEPWTFYVDPVYRLRETSRYTQCDVQQDSASQCVKKLKDAIANEKNDISEDQGKAFFQFTKLSSQASRDLIEQIQDTTGLSLITDYNPEDDYVKAWDFSSAFFKPEYNHLTITPLGSENFGDIANYRIMIHLSKNVSQNAGDFPKCRVFDIPGHHVTLEHMFLFTSKCFTFYQAPGQVFGDDGTAISFSGTSAAGSKVKNVYVESLENYNRDVQSSSSASGGYGEGDTSMKYYSISGVALRVGNAEYGTIDASGMEINITTVNANASVVLYDYEAKTEPVINMQCGNTWKQNTDSSTFDDKVSCIVLYKQGFPDTKAPVLTFTPANENSPATIGVNISDIIPPEFAFFKPSQVRYGRDAHACRCPYTYAEAATATLGSLLALLAIVVLGRQTVKFHRDSSQRDLELYMKQNQ